MVPEIVSNKTKIENILKKYKPTNDDELKRDIARYVCVLVSGYIEESLRLLINEYVRGKSTPIIQHYVDSNIKRITNCKYNKIVEILNAFHPPWAADFSSIIEAQEPIPNQYKDSIDSVVTTRHKIAHGKNTGISIVKIEEYFKNVDKAVAILDQSIK
jgi:hypothetical protein